MRKNVVLPVEEKKLHKLVTGTLFYLGEAISIGDFESAYLEIEELKFLIKQMKEFQAKRMRRKALEEMVHSMQSRGIHIGFANNSRFFLDQNGKNAVDPVGNFRKIDKKGQQA